MHLSSSIGDINAHFIVGAQAAMILTSTLPAPSRRSMCIWCHFRSLQVSDARARSGLILVVVVVPGGDV